MNSHDLSTLNSLLDHALDLEPCGLEAWFSVLPTEHCHLLTTLRELLCTQRSGAFTGFMSAGPKLRASPEPVVATPGDTLGAYRLIREIGSGGMSSVWLAEHSSAVNNGTANERHRRVAIKLPRPSQGARAPELARRMVREGEIAARLAHPNVARLLGSGADAGGRPFLVFEYVDGQPLDAWCTQKGLGVAERVRLFQQLLRAVAHLHRHGVVHRDLKPSNVLVTAKGRVCLIDFGISALALSADRPAAEAETERCHSLTPGYASPEQLRGAAPACASDVYSLGVMLFELVTQVLPCRRERRDWMSAGLLPAAEPPAASTAVLDETTARQLRGRVDAIIAKALQQAPARRHASVEALDRDITHFLAQHAPRSNRVGHWIMERSTWRGAPVHSPARRAKDAAATTSSTTLLERDAGQIRLRGRRTGLLRCEESAAATAGMPASFQRDERGDATFRIG